MFRPRVPYEEAVVSNDPALRESATNTANSRNRFKNSSTFDSTANFAARSAIRKNYLPVNSGALKSQGSTANTGLGPPLHPDRTTEHELYNQLIRDSLMHDSKTAGEWDQLKTIHLSYPDQKKLYLSPEESSRGLEHYRRNFKNLGYKTQLFSELHPCDGPSGCENFLRGTLGDGDQVYHSVPYNMEYNARNEKLFADHRKAIQAIQQREEALPPLPTSSVVQNFQLPSSRMRGPIDRFLTPITHVPPNIPFDVAMSLMGPNMDNPLVPWSPSSSAEMGLPETLSTPVSLYSASSSASSRPKYGVTSSSSSSQSPRPSYPSLSLKDALKNPKKRERPTGWDNPADDEITRVMSGIYSMGPPTSRGSLRGYAPPPSHSPLRENYLYDELPPLVESSLDDELSPAPVAPPVPPVPPTQETPSFYFNKFRGNNSALGDYRRGGPVTFRNKNSSRGMNIYERMLLGYI